MAVAGTYQPYTYAPGALMAEQSLANIVWFTNSQIAVERVLADGTRETCVEGVDYQLGGSPATGAGWIKALAAEAVGVTFEVTRETSKLQQSVYPAHQGIKSAQVERDFDLAALRDQEIDVKAGQAIELAEEAKAIVEAIPKGDPGGNVLAVGLFSQLGTFTVPVGTNMIQTSGHAALGIGSAIYINDATANAGLALAHPLLCKADAAGRHFRLVGLQITAEQAGADYSGDDRPAFQAAINYAKAVGIRRLTVEKDYAAFEWWAPPPPVLAANGYTDAFSLTQNGDFLTISADLFCDFRFATINMKGYAGGSLQTQMQAAPGGNLNGYTNWRGSGIAVLGGTAASPAAYNVMRIGIANVTIDGGCDRGAGGLSDSDLSHKGFRVQDTQVGELYFENVTLKRFRGEIWYFAAQRGLGAEAYGHPLTTLINCRGFTGNQSALNPNSGKLIVIGGEYGDTPIAIESLGGAGQYYDGVRFYNASHTQGALFCGAAGYNGFAAGYSFTSPTDTGSEDLPPWITFNNVVFDKVGQIGMYSLVRGQVGLIDSNVLIESVTPGQVRNVSLEIDHTAHKTSVAALTLQGPDTATTAYRSTGTFIQPLKNMDITVRSRRSAHARANNLQPNATVLYAGLIEQSSVSIRIEESESRELVGAFGSVSSIRSMPRFIAVNKTGLNIANGSGRPSGGRSIAVDMSSPSPFLISVYSPYELLGHSGAAATLTMGMAAPFSAPYGYAFRQRVRLEYDGYSSNGTVYAFPKNGTRLRLNADRRLATGGDFLELEWNEYTARWHEVEFCSSSTTEVGWTQGTGTPNKAAFAAYAGATINASYSQAQVQATDNAARDASQRVLALENALRAAGIIN